RFSTLLPTSRSLPGGHHDAPYHRACDLSIGNATRLTDLAQVLAASLLPTALAAPSSERIPVALQKRKYVIHKGAANEPHWPSMESWVSFNELYVPSPIASNQLTTNPRWRRNAAYIA